VSSAARSWEGIGEAVVDSDRTPEQSGSWESHRIDVLRRLRGAEDVTKEIHSLREAIAVLQTKVAIYAAGIAFVVAAGVAIVERLVLK
jgi:hypothetical protein